MAYRKLTVDGQEYEYTIGRSFVKIRGKGAFPLEQIGISAPNEQGYIVTPGTIAEFLMTGIVKQERYCEGTAHRPDSYRSIYGEPTPAPKIFGLRVLPFDAEIRGKIRYVALCEDCLNENAMEI